VGAPAGRLMSFQDGMQELPDGVARTLGDRVRPGTPAVRLRKGFERDAFTGGAASGYSVGTPRGSFEADAVVLAGPADVSARLIQAFDPTLASLVAGIETAPIVVVCLGYDEAALAADRGPLNGFGFLVPRSEGTRILGALWETSIYTGRAPAGKALLRVMIGGASDPMAGTLDDDELLAVTRTDLHRTMGLSIAPEFTRVIRHHRGIPQYTRGHVARLQRIGGLLKAHRGLFLAGNAYRGVSINACIAEAGDIADAILEATPSPLPIPPRWRPASPPPPRRPRP
jgi:protoporphyrinogen/coproporphyrinogen III oxidase